MLQGFFCVCIFAAIHLQNSVSEAVPEYKSGSVKNDAEITRLEQRPPDTDCGRDMTPPCD